MKRTLVRTVALAATLLLAACAGPRPRPDGSVVDEAALAAQAQREHTLAARTEWGLVGRLAVSAGGDGGSGSLEWRQHGAEYRVTVQAPVTGKTWVLLGDAHGAMLEGLHPQPVGDADAAALLRRELGWEVPIAQLGTWLRGMRADGPSRLRFDADGLPLELVQGGWTIEYKDYDRQLAPPLPRKVFARRGDYRVRLSVQRWDAP